MAELNLRRTKKIRESVPAGRATSLRSPVRKNVRQNWTQSFGTRPAAFFLVAVIVVVSLAITARGSSFEYYPETCLGSWLAPEKAQGEPDVKAGLASSGQFQQANSAVFFGGTHSIICQSFIGQTIPDDATLTYLTVALSLAVKHPRQVAPAPEVIIEEVIENEGGGAGGNSDEQEGTEPAPEPEFTIVDEPVSEPTPTTEEAPVEPGEQGNGVGAQMKEENASEKAPASESTVEPEPTPAAESELAPAPASEPEPEPAPAPEPAPSEPSAFKFPFIRRASAQAQDEILATVLYSLDGSDWRPIGSITQEDWQNKVFQIPVGEGGVSSVTDIPNVRIRLDASYFSVDNSIEVYLDGMTVEINTDEYVTEEVILEPDEEVLPPPLEIMDLPQIIQSIKRTFSLMGDVVPTQQVLPWQPYDYQMKNEKKSREVGQSVATSNSGSGEIVVSGSCSQKYYAVLIFRSEDDYASNPSSAVFNSAYPCKGGSYSFELDPDRVNLREGTYYLLVADQPEAGPWVPISGLMQFGVEVE